jgi:hypothetical protein
MISPVRVPPGFFWLSRSKQNSQKSSMATNRDRLCAPVPPVRYPNGVFDDAAPLENGRSPARVT